MDKYIPNYLTLPALKYDKFYWGSQKFTAVDMLGAVSDNHF
jgi:hypothetical protein